MNRLSLSREPLFLLLVEVRRFQLVPIRSIDHCDDGVQSDSGERCEVLFHAGGIGVVGLIRWHHHNLLQHGFKVVIWREWNWQMSLRVVEASFHEQHLLALILEALTKP